MRVSIITASFNNEKTIKKTLESVKNQKYKEIEHIIIDGNSTDNTIKIAKKYKHIDKIISEKDKGIYYALNKGIQISTGEIIGFLHADDFLANNSIIEKIISVFKNKITDAVYGDLEYVSSNSANKIIRYWKSNQFTEGMLEKGWMPPHPTLYVKKRLYTETGLFNTDYKISADYDFMLRIFSKKINSEYLPEVIVKMRIGGVSNRNLKTIIQKSKEDLRAIKHNKIGGILCLLKKNTSKISQFLKKQ